MRYHWRYEVLKWLPGFHFSRIQILQNERDVFSLDAQVIIVSFEIALRIQNRLKFKVVIVDESESIFKSSSNNGLYNLDSIGKP